MRRGFSLVELSIVLVILGLLVGGILAGQALIQAAELRTVSADLTRITTVTAAFKDKYFALPGDMNNAISFWGRDAVGCSWQSGATATPGSCNGNGNGYVDSGLTDHELYRAWDHLSKAGLWEGTWPGTRSIAAGQTVAGDNPGVNLPMSRYNRGVTVTYTYRTAGTTDFYNSNAPTRTRLYVGGGMNTCCASPFVDGGAIPSVDAWNLDVKLDDGQPDFGTMQIKQGYYGGCATSASAPAAEYSMSNTLRCPLFYELGILP